MRARTIVKELSSRQLSNLAANFWKAYSLRGLRERKDLARGPNVLQLEGHALASIPRVHLHLISEIHRTFGERDPVSHSETDRVQSGCGIERKLQMMLLA